MFLSKALFEEALVKMKNVTVATSVVNMLNRLLQQLCGSIWSEV